MENVEINITPMSLKNGVMGLPIQCCRNWDASGSVEGIFQYAGRKSSITFSPKHKNKERGTAAAWQFTVNDSIQFNQLRMDGIHTYVEEISIGEKLICSLCESGGLYFLIDGIPQGKRISLKKFYDTLLAKDELTQAPKGKDKLFPDGDTVLSCCIYSLYENVIEVLDTYTGIDVMGEFYTTFLRFTKGNAKEKGIVLTPKHVTELFCDIAEFYSDRKFDENTKILDICCGTGAFLIASLNRIKQNIQSEVVSDEKKVSRYEDAQKNSLIGVERDASMYALAYANMRFHGDGKSNLFNCSSLLIDSYAPVDDSGKTYSHVGTATCIMVFKAHIPHDKNKATFFGRWQNDGFKVIPHNGRKDTGAWSSIREEWINQLDGTAAIDDTIWLRKKINPNDEALAEAYIETDYNKLDDSVFERTIKKYALYKYMDEKGLLGD